MAKKAVISKAAMRDVAHAHIDVDAVKRILDSMLAASVGMWLFQKRNPLGEFEEIEDVEEFRKVMADPKLEEGRDYRFVSFRVPDTRAATLLLAYRLDKPAEQKQVLEVSGTLTIDEVLNRARKRLGKR